MSSVNACWRVTYRRICCSSLCISLWYTLCGLITYGACYAMTVGVWNLVSPPADYASSVPLSMAIFVALIIVPWTILAVGYCLCYNAAWDPQRNTWTPEPTGFWRSCHCASVWFYCQCPGLIPFCRGYCSEVGQEIQADKTAKGGYVKEENQNKMPPPPSIPPV